MVAAADAVGVVRRIVLLAMLLLAALPCAAWAAPHLPPSGRIWHGLTAGESSSDFERRTGKHPAVWQHFVRWGQTYQYAFDRSAGARARVMLHISTADGQNRPGRITPGEIARGEGDRYLLWLNRRLAQHGQPVYLRLMGEMNNCDNAYAAYGCDGRRRSRDHSAASFRQAWRRAHLVVNGGDVRRVNARLRALGLPPLRSQQTSLPRPRVAFVWAPMTGGSPMIAALDPGVYWPGRSYVDWVGTSFYSRYPNFHYLEPFYERFAVRYRKPFAIAEWAMWGSDSAAFARRLMAWIRTHRRVRMVQYNQGSDASGPFRLRRYPHAAGVLRRALRSAAFAGFAPEMTAQRG